ncbi:gastrula zinc finger protein XlCGF52.1-like [Zophobas morio]|uniref:gastrula zinc finger protein XlCGF52.1-like n=1 Tax=Zophobas morio TaxID=2755281 RepID=UPI0030831457
MDSDSFTIHVLSLAICRTCLQTSGRLTPLTDSKATEMLRDCNFCNVSENDGLPTQICCTCLQILEQCYSFRQLCRRSESTLRKALERNDKSQPNYKNKSEISQDNSCDSSDSRDLVKSQVKAEEDCNTLELSENEEMSLREDLISFLDEPLPPPLRHQCQTCTQSFNEESDLKIHTSVHNPDLVCTSCSKKFTRRQALKRHLKIHLTQKPHTCKICSKSFPESYALVKHLRHHSGVPREKKHFCEECGQGFSEPYYLKVHMRKHTGERPLVCATCQKTFADPRSLKTHVMIHNGDKPHKCTFCPKSFIQNAHLTRHLRVHTGEKPFVCSICDVKFSQSSALQKHLRSHSQQKTLRVDVSWSL